MPRSSSRRSSTTRCELRRRADRDRPLRAGARGRRRAIELLKGLDPLKDQSYFLHRLNQAQLAKTLFPLGEIAKTEVRRIAAEIGLPNAKKKDSTGICFIGERPFREFLNRYLANAPGPIEDDRGRTVGEHVGLSFYTLGQRKGIGIGGVKERAGARGGSDHAPWFVARKDLARNALIVVQGHDHPWLLSSALVAADASWVAGQPPRRGRVGGEDALPAGRRRVRVRGGIDDDGAGEAASASACASSSRNGRSRRASRRCCTPATSASAAA